MPAWEQLRENYPDIYGGMNARGLLGGAYRLQNKSYVPTPDTKIMEEIKGRALSQGPSTWAKLMLDRQKQMEADALAEASRGAQINQTALMNQLASRGGIRSGAGLTMGRQLARDAALDQQKIRSQGMTSRLGILTDDESKRLGLLTQAPGLINQSMDPFYKRQQTQLGVDQYNIDRALNQKTAEDLNRAQEYSENMRAWAAGQQAKAIDASGKK